MSDHLPALQQQLEREVLLHRITDRIRQSLELKEILTTTTAEVRSVLGTDRVMVYRFHEDGSGEVIAESIGQQRLPSLQGLNFPADDIPQQAREMFVKLRVRSIVDREAGLIGWSPIPEEQKDEEITRNDLQSLVPTRKIDYRQLDSCHLEYLTAMGISSSLVVPILVSQDFTPDSQSLKASLWGLLVSHHSEARQISPEDLELVQRVADRVSIAIAQSNLLAQARTRSQREVTINHIATLLHTQPEIQLQAALDATVTALQGIGGQLYLSRDRQLFVSGEQPQLDPKTQLEEYWQQWESTQTSNSLSTIADLYQDPQWSPFVPAFRSTPIRSISMVSLQYRQKHLGYLSVFRGAIDTERLWAGRFNPNQKQLRPRQSFETWREQKRGQAQGWKSAEGELLQAIGEQFSMAIQQYQLYQQVRSLNANLELQVQERTAKLQQALQFNHLRKQITDQIRSTLDLPTILSTIVREVRALLATDRVAIYQLNPERTGEVIVEDVRGNWLSILGFQAPPECFPEKSARLAATGIVRAIEDTADESFVSCHREFLQSLQVQANLTVPIRRELQLWGLLIVHECHAPRVWQPAEIELLEQLANQAAIAIGQAELYKQSQQATAAAQAQAERAELALQDLKQAQTQLIQSEKMSALGQLVAGVAHEINNPVNFIYGNLKHANEYIQDLMALVELYQARYLHRDTEIEQFAEEIDLDFMMEDLPKILNSMQLGADRIRHIVLSLRNFSHLDRAEMRPVDIHQGIEDTLLILQYRLKAKSNRSKIQIIQEYGNLPIVECYAGELNQVFMNLIGNAIDALEEKIAQGNCPQPTLWIRTKVLPNQRVYIEIEDNGSGIPEPVRSRIFEPFFTTKPVGIGTGLGLSISYQIIVEKHGGRFECFSQPGQGTKFQIEIPIHPNPQPKIQAA